MTILTGFKPFHQFAVNSSWEAVKAASRKRQGLLIRELTVDHPVAHREITELLISSPCEILLLSGLADYPAIHIEMRARKPGELSFVEGPSLLEGSWDWEENLARLKSAGIPASLSTDAGQYVCESTYWSALNFRRINGYPRMVAFFHLPVLSTLWNEDRLSEALLLSLDSLARMDYLV